MFRRYKPWQRGDFVLCFADTAAGGGDYCAAQFLRKDQIDIPLVYHSKTIATEMTPVLHKELESIFDITGLQPVVCYERNNGGVFEIERLASLNRRGKYRIYEQKTGVGDKGATGISKRLGWDTNTATRPAMLSMLKDAIDNRAITIYDRPTVNEMFSFIVNQTTSSWKAQAEQGAHDDLIMSLAGVWQMYQTEEPIKLEDEEVYEPSMFEGGFYI